MRTTTLRLPGTAEARLSALLLLSIASTATTHMISLAPVIRLPVGVGDHLVVEEGRELRLVCEGAGPLHWTYPPGDWRLPEILSPPAAERPDHVDAGQVVSRSILHRPRADRRHTGLYDCSSGPYGDFIYVYVTSMKSPWVWRKINIRVPEFSSVILDCRPNKPHTKVQLLDANNFKIPLGQHEMDGTTLSWNEREGFLWANVSRKHSGRYYCVAEGRRQLTRRPRTRRPQAKRPVRLPVNLAITSGHGFLPGSDKDLKKMYEKENTETTQIGDLAEEKDMRKKHTKEIEHTQRKQIVETEEKAHAGDLPEKENMETMEEMEDSADKSETENTEEMENKGQRLELTTPKSILNTATKKDLSALKFTTVYGIVHIVKFII